MSIVEISNITKNYPAFSLKNVSFGINEGEITGFIGRNGAGKTTTIKSMLGLVHPDAGKISYFGKDLTENENEIKNLIGYSTGSITWYPRKKLCDIVNIIKKFYTSWDDEKYFQYIKLFDLDENKAAMELSDGMKIKFNLAMALSHNAKVLILDEPTSGLDPFSRDELLCAFEKIKESGVAVFFSTHIISDIEKCADNIIYISKGQIVASENKQDFIKKYSLESETLEEIFLRLERGNISNE